MKICHVISMSDISKMGYITRKIYELCEGDHVWCGLYEEPIDADVYMLHCFKNEKHLDAFRNYNADGVIISILHSSDPCMPSINSNVVITLTEWQRGYMKDTHGIDSIVIAGGIDTEKYRCDRDYTNRDIIRVARTERGKWHDDFFLVLTELLDYNKMQASIICNNPLLLDGFIISDRIIYITDIDIDEEQRKIDILHCTGVYVECHKEGGEFVETFGYAMLEAMAMGLPVLIIGSNQPALKEVGGDGIIVAENIEHWRKELLKLLQDKGRRKEAGKKARRRAEEFTLPKMIDRYNEVLHEYSSN